MLSVSHPQQANSCSLRSTSLNSIKIPTQSRCRGHKLQMNLLYPSDQILQPGFHPFL